MNKSEQLKETYHGMLIMQLQGMFYNTYEESAFALSSIMGYQVRRKSDKSKNKCGFPSKALDKVVNQLKSCNVSYVVIEGTEVVDAEDFNAKNKFMDYVNSFNKDNIVTNMVKNSSEVETDITILSDIGSNDVIEFTFIGTDYLDTNRKYNELIQGKEVTALNFQGYKNENKFILKGKIKYA